MSSYTGDRHGLSRQAASHAVDLDAVCSVDPGAIIAHPEQAEALFLVLQEANAKDVRDESAANDPAYWRRLFEVTQAVLKIKGEDSLIALQALALQEEESKGFSERIAELESQLSDGQSGERRRLTRMSTSHQQLLRDDLAALEKRNVKLDQDLRAAEIDLGRERSEKEWLKTENDQQSAKIAQLTRENQTLQHAAQDYQGQLQTYRASLQDQRGYDAEERERQKLHNIKLSDELDQMRLNLMASNEQLIKERDALAGELEVATRDMLEVSEEIARLKAVIKQSDQTIRTITKEKDQLIGEMHHKEMAYKEKSSAEDAMMSVIDQKVDEWKQLLDSRNAEIAECKRELEKQRYDVFTARSDKSQSFKLAQIARDREDQVLLLNQQLKEQSVALEQAANEMEQLRKESATTKARRTIADLESANKKLAEQAQRDRQLLEQANSDASEKDRQLAESLAKVNDLVKGVYGLPEAVKETDNLKAQLGVRDTEIKNLVESVNRLEIAASSLEDENTELCKKFGVDRGKSQVTAELRYGQRVTNEQEKAKVRLLTREVEKLEQERVELKRQFLVQAMHRGERAVELNLTTEDLVAVEEFAELLRQAQRRNEPKPSPVEVLTSQQSLAQWKEELQQRDDELDKVRAACRHATNAKELLTTERDDLRARLHTSEVENVELSKVLKDVTQQLKHAESTGNTQVDESLISAISGKPLSSVLEELLAIWHSRHSSEGAGAIVSQLRAQVEQLVGKAGQLQEQLNQSQTACDRLTSQAARKDLQIENLESDIVALRQAGKLAARHQSSKLPGEISLTSAEVIASQNKQLLHTLNRLTEQKEKLQRTELALTKAQGQVVTILHQQSILYDEYQAKKTYWQKKEVQLKEDRTKMEDRHMSDQIKIANLKRMEDSLRSGGSKTDDQRMYTLELNQRVTELEINEKVLRRQLALVEDNRSHLEKDCCTLRADFSAMERSSRERISLLQAYRIKSESFFTTLQQQLEDSVPKTDLQAMQSTLTDISTKYRAVLRQQSHKDELQSVLDDQTAQLNLYKDQVERLQTELCLAKEIAHKAEHLLETTSKQSGSSGSSSQSSQKVSLLEMKALSAEQKAELAEQKLKQSLTTQSQLEGRNTQLEQHFEELTKLNLEAQQQESSLRRELEGSIPASEASSLKEQMRSLLESESSLRSDVAKLQELLNLAQHQSSSTQLKETVDQMELASLRTQLRQFQSGSDEKTLIGKLHRQVVTLEVREATALHRLMQAATKVTSLEALVSSLQEETNAKTECLYQCKVSAINKQRYLRNTIQVLRRRYAGCIPLSQQEQFSALLQQTKAAKIQAEKKLKEAVEQQIKVDDQLSELQLRLSSVQELVNSLKDGTHTSKVVKWHGKMEEVRLENLRHLRTIDRLKEEVSALRSTCNRQEENAILSEENLVSQQQQHESEALAWEVREAELEDALQQLQMTQENMLRSANEFASSGQLMPDPAEPVAVQLEKAVRRLKEQALRCSNLQSQCDLFEKEKKVLKEEKTALEHQIVRKEKIETELRIRLTGQPNDVAVGEDPVSTRDKEAVRLAQDMIDSLQQQLKHKELALLKYQGRLVQVQEECASVTDEQKEKIAFLSQQLQSQKHEIFQNLKQAAVKSVEVADPPLPTKKQLARLRELEDVTAEQEQTVATLLEKLKQAKSEHQHAEETWARSMKALKHEMKKQQSANEEELKRSRDANAELEKEILALQEQLEVTQAELESAKEAAHHAPSRTMKVLVDKLKQQLSTKENQHQALTKALAQLREDMTSMAEQQIKDKMSSADQDLNIQRLIDAHTVKLKTHVEDLQARLNGLMSQSEKQRKGEMKLKERIAELQESVRLKDSSLSRQSKALQDLEDEQQKSTERHHELVQQLSSKADTAAQKQELTQLRARCRTLQSQLEKQRGEASQLQKKLDTLKASQTKPERSSVTASGHGEVQRWEESKRLQHRCESLLKKLKEKEKEQEASSKQTAMLKETVTRLERERNSLLQRMKRLSVQPASVSTTGHAVVAEDVERLRQENHQLEKEVKVLRERLTRQPTATPGVKVPSSKLQVEVNDLKKRLAKDGAECERLRVANSQLEKGMADLTTKLAEAREVRQAPATSGSSSDLQTQIDGLQTEMTRKNRMLQEVKRHLKGAAQQEQQLQEKCSQLESQVATLRSSVPASSQRLMEDLQAAREAVHSSESRYAELAAELAHVKKDTSEATANDIMMLRAENEKMRSELSAFDPQFFSELEDLKQNYQQVTQLNQRYEEQLVQLGVDIAS